MTKPYVYIIGWTKLKKFYIGSKTAENCCPQNFWNYRTYKDNRRGSYFTSSKHVTAFHYAHGEPDFIDTYPFSSTKATRKVEAMFLKRARANKHLFLNRSFAEAPPSQKGKKQSEEHKRRKAAAIKGIKRSEEQKQKQSDAMKGRTPWNKGIPRTEEEKQRMSKASKGQVAWNKGIPRTEEEKQAISAGVKASLARKEADVG